MTNTNKKKLLSFTAQEWKQIDDYRFMNRINTQTETIKELINLGLQSRRTSFTDTANEIKNKYGDLFQKFEGK